MNIGLDGIFFLWVGFFKIFFIPMLIIPVLLVPLFLIIKKNYIYKKARFFVISTFFSYLIVFALSFISVYCPVNTIYKYFILWLLEFSLCYYLVLILFRKQLHDKKVKGIFSNKSIALGITLLFITLVLSSFVVDYYFSDGTFKVDGNILIVEIEKSITDTRKIISYFNRVPNSDSTILIQINSSGGASGEILHLSNTILELDNRTCCYINGECYGGAVFIALSCNEIIMQEGSKIGKIGPIRLRETDLIEKRNKISLEDRINNEMKQKALYFTNSKYDSHVILGMFGENNSELSKINSSLIKISEANPLVLSAEMAFDLKVSQKTVKEFSDVLEFLRK